MKNTKKALLMSAMSLLLCVSMLAGTTFAWFTDSVSTGVNTIAAGNLDVDVYYGDPALEQSIEGVSTLFNDVTLWEPGAVAYENLTIANLGSLALKYQMSVAFDNYNSVQVDGDPEYSLPQILQVGLVPGGIDDSLTREAVVAAVNAWYPMESKTWEGELLANTNEETMGVVIWWEPSGEDNNWNLNNGKVTDDGADHLYVDLGINLVATQLMEESDSFDNTYDESAEYPIAVGGTLEEGAADGLTLNAGRITVTVPAGSPAGGYKLNVNSLSLVVDSEGNGDLDTNFAVTKDGVATENVTYKVQIQLDIMSEDLKVTHKGQEITDFTYDPFTGVVEFTTDTFSPFTVDYTIFGTEVKMDAENKKILSGFFKEVNPATLDASLLGDSAEYIAVDFVKGGEKIYAVSKRATTVIVGNEASTYTGENVSLPVVDDNGNIYQIISGLQSNAHSTVYILPGTYEEDTQINVCSSMDIIGMGDAENIKIIKVKGSYSNRHLFNCNGAVAREEHIQVTIRNLYLDASAKNLDSAGKYYFTDNGAVQSIRMSKVKCYDLIIAKSSGFAFYVNGKYDARGAYLYAENCTMATNSVVDTASTYRFFYNNLTYGKGSYASNTSYIKNTPMAWDDWTWD